MNNGREEKILAALLATSTVRDASKKCGVPERTIHRRLADPRTSARNTSSGALNLSASHGTGCAARSKMQLPSCAN